MEIISVKDIDNKINILEIEAKILFEKSQIKFKEECMEKYGSEWSLFEFYKKQNEISSLKIVKYTNILEKNFNKSEN